MHLASTRKWILWTNIKLVFRRKVMRAQFGTNTVVRRKIPLKLTSTKRPKHREVIHITLKDITAI